MLNMGVAGTPVKVREREIAFVATYDTAVKSTIEKAFLKHRISYLIKMDKIRRMRRVQTYLKKSFRKKVLHI